MRKRYWFIPVIIVASCLLLYFVGGGGKDLLNQSSQDIHIYPDELQGSHSYNLDLHQSRVFEVYLDKQGFDYPVDAPTENVTAILKFELIRPEKSNGERKITISTETHSIAQHFAFNSAGSRYLNISPILARNNKRIQMVGQHVNWRVGLTKLIIFRNPNINQSTRTLIISPHPDDAEISSFGLYSMTDSDIVTITAGDAGHKNYEALFEDDAKHYQIKGKIRVLDSLIIPFLGGVPFGRARNLGFFDGTLRRLYEQNPEIVPPLYAKLNDPSFFRRLNIDRQLATSYFESSWPSLIADIISEVNQVEPEFIVAPNPLLDTHSDHQYTTIALIQALEILNYDGLLLFYTNHTNYIDDYPLGPSTAVESLPPWFGNDLPFNSVFSYQVDEELRRLNYLALESMHDIRSFNCYNQNFNYNETRCLSSISDYMRRGPRQNKIYLVLDLEQAIILREQFLSKEAHES